MRKITFAIYMNNNGDGSASPKFFPDMEAATRYADQDDERMCDDIEMHSILIDDDGRLVAPPKTKMREDGVLIEDFKIGKHTYDEPTDYRAR